MCGIGVVSRIDVTRIPACVSARIADSRPPPGPLTRTSTSRIPASLALRAASEEACCAANGVPFREPRKPRAPDEHWATKFPWVSVIEIRVLLNDAEMNTIPVGIFFRSFFLKVFFLVAAGFVAIVDHCYFLPGAFFLATAAFLGPLRVRAFVEVRWPRTGRLRL